MGLKCRLLGHAYGDSEVERNREEQGDEVVVTIREVQVCERCGTEQVVSQNKEVTAIRSPAEVGLDGPSSTGGDTPSTANNARAPPTQTEATDGTDGPTTPAGPGAQGDASGDRTPEGASASPSDDADDGAPDPGASSDTPSTADGDVTEREPADGSTPESPEISSEDESVAEASTEAIADAESDGWETGSDDWDDVETDPDADDAVILDNEEAERDETQWPEETDADPTSAAQHTATAEDDDVPAGTDAPGTDEDEETEVTNDAEIIDGEEDVDDAPQERGHGEWPEREGDPAAGGWPDHGGEDEGYAAAVDEEADVELAGSGLTPEVNGRSDLEESGDRTVQGVAVERDRPADEQRVDRRDTPEEAQDDGFIRAGESTTLESDVPDDHIEFYCPNCGHARTAGASSMRAGDICPECKQGYIAERER